MSSEASDKRPQRRAPGPGPFDPGPEFDYDPDRARQPPESDDPVRDEAGPGPFGPGPFDPGPEVEYAPDRRRNPQPEPPLEPEQEPEPEPPPEPEPEPPQPEVGATGPPLDSLDPAPWVPREPARPPPPTRRPRRAPRPRRTRRPVRARLVVIAGALTAVAAGVAWAADISVTSPFDTGGGRPRVAAAGVGASPGEREVRDEDPSSLAITSDSGPFHPVLSDRKIDYGEAAARFGASRYGHTHEGQDMFAKPGTPLVAVRDGVVVARGNDGGRGNYIGIYSPEVDRTYVYLHMVKPSWLKRGQRVTAGTQVGGMGCTGSCDGTHLHFEIRRGDDIENKAIDPLPSLKSWPQAPPLKDR